VGHQAEDVVSLQEEGAVDLRGGGAADLRGEDAANRLEGGAVLHEAGAADLQNAKGVADHQGGGEEGVVLQNVIEAGHQSDEEGDVETVALAHLGEVDAEAVHLKRSGTEARIRKRTLIKRKGRRKRNRLFAFGKGIVSSSNHETAGCLRKLKRSLMTLRRGWTTLFGYQCKEEW